MEQEHRRQIFLAVTFLLLTVMFFDARPRTLSHAAPAGITAAPNGDLFVLERSGAISLVAQNTGQFVEELYRVAPPFLAPDIAAILSGSGSEVIIAVYSAETTGVRSWLIQAKPNAKETWRFMSHSHLLGAIAAAPVEPYTIYAASTFTGDIFKVVSNNRLRVGEDRSLP